MLSHVFLLKVFMIRHLFCVFRTSLKSLCSVHHWNHCDIYTDMRLSADMFIYKHTRNEVIKCHTNHSVCLKPAAVMRRRKTQHWQNVDLCSEMYARSKECHLFDRRSLHTPWWYGLWAPHSRTLLTKGFLGSLCEESQWLAWITSEFIQSHHSCNDLPITSLSVGGVT